MKKLEKEQLPKVIALGAVAVLLVGYAGFTWLGHGGAAATPAAASTPHPAEAAPAALGAQRVDPVMALAPIDHENPFIPAFQASTSAPAPKPAPPPAKPAHPPAVGPAAATSTTGGQPAPKHGTAAPAMMMAALPDTLTGPAMDGLPGVTLPSTAAKGPAAHGSTSQPAAATSSAHPATGARAQQPAKPAAPARGNAGPSAPAVVVTGILEGQENVAILKWSDTQRQVVRKGDRLEGGYVVKEIRSDAVVLTSGSHQWLVRLGNSN